MCLLKCLLSVYNYSEGKKQKLKFMYSLKDALVPDENFYSTLVRVKRDPDTGDIFQVSWTSNLTD